MDTIVLTPGRRALDLGVGDLWRHRELLAFFVWRDIRVRYKQTLLGAAWAILQPLLTMIIFTIFFGRLAGIRSDDLPYPLFSYAGLLPWTMFAQSVGLAASSLIQSTNLITKVYFPRPLIPMATVLSSLVDLGLASFLLAGLMAYYGVAPTWTVVAVPFVVLVALVFATGVGLWLSALNVEYRDVRYVVPFLVQLWLFVTPVIYPTSFVTTKLVELGVPEWIYGLNPMVGVVQGFRWAVLGAGAPPLALLAVGSVTSAFVFVSGMLYFRRMERSFADVI